MLGKILQNTFLKIAILLMFFVVSFSSSINESYATVYNTSARNVTWVNKNNATFNSEKPWKSTNYHCTPDTLVFKPFMPNDDETWELENPVCITHLATTALVTFGAGMLAGKLCKMTVKDGILSKARAAGTGTPAATIIDTALKSASCTAQIKLCVTSLGTKCDDAAACCSALGAYVVAQGLQIASLAIINKVARDAQQYARVCGRNWYVWQQIDVVTDGNTEKLWSQGRYGDWVSKPPSNYDYNNYDGAYSKYLDDKNKLGKISYDITNKEYRELIYGGVEYVDKEEDGCANPRWDAKTLKRVLGYTTSGQRYYMKGAGQASNYACERFAIFDNDNNRRLGKIAQDCCTKRSQETFCMESSNSVVKGNGYDYRFCKVGTRCNVKEVYYDIYESTVLTDTICAKTYSVCPYNHYMGGGTETAKTSNGVVLNYCQYQKNCVKRPPKAYFRTSNITGEYIAAACFDLAGDSQNTYSYSNSLISLNNKHLSAPIAQCFHETLYNLFLNRAGHVKCKNPEEIPDKKTGSCPGGTQQKVGDTLPTTSFFAKLQSNLGLVIKLVLTASIMLIGLTILRGGSMIERKEITMFIVKIGLIMYFALGTAWQTYFFDGLYKSATYMANFMMRINDSSIVISSINTSDNSQSIIPLSITVANADEVVTNNNGVSTVTLKDIANDDVIVLRELNDIPSLNNQKFLVKNLKNRTFNIQPKNGTELVKITALPSYSNGSAYVALEKKLDGCQFPKFNYKDEDPKTMYNNPTYPPGKEYLRIWDTLDCKIVRTLGYGPGFSVPQIFTLILSAFFTGGAGIVFVCAAAILIFCLISIAIRALHMFLLSTIAIVLFIYISPIAITLSLFKKTNDIFKKWWSNLFGFILQPLLLFAFLGILITVFDSTIAGDINYRGDGYTGPKIVDCTSYAAKESIYCIFGELGIKTNNISALGIGMPSLEVLDPSSGRLKAIVFVVVKSAFLLFIFMQFFEKMSSFSSSLVGGGLSPTSINIGKVMGQGYDAIRGVQKRAARGLVKLGGKVARGGASAARGVGGAAQAMGRAVGSRGNSVNDSNSSTSDSARAEAKPTSNSKSKS